MDLREPISKAASHLLEFQREDGRFEGDLSANTFPTCAYSLVQVAMGNTIDDDLIEWFAQNQNDQGYWGLDASGGSDNEATLFAMLALKEMKRAVDRGICPAGSMAPEEDAAKIPHEIDAILARSPDIPLSLWIVKIMYARGGYIPWEDVMAPGFVNAAMRLMEWIMPILPKSLLSRLKPPVSFAPPVRLFYSSAFQDLFIAEKYTLVPLLLIIEAHTGKREEVILDLARWILENKCADGSWFRVGLITAISLLALIDVKLFSREMENAASFFDDNQLDLVISEGCEWLQNLRTKDGGCREAVNLNVWDTALSIISLKSIGADGYKHETDRGARWLLENQNEDGGWPFSGLPGGNLPSDADDTALATLALLKTGISKEHDAILRSTEWFRSQQARDGGWGTYIPGTGDVSCVSITSHVIEACLAMDELAEEIQRAVTWLKSAMSDSGYWDDLWLARNTYGTALAIAALVKSGHADCVEVEKGVRWLEENQNSDGGWGENMTGHKIRSTVEQTAWSTYALLLAEGAMGKFPYPSEENGGTQNDSSNVLIRKGIEHLLRHQRADGSWPSSCVGIYWEIIGGYIDPVYPSVFAMMALCQAESK